MKAFHLSDLHLGKRIYEFSMLEEQRHILDEILGMADDERPDVVLVAGDIFDRTIPSEEAILLWDDFLNHLCDRQIPVCAISGNHDSAVRFSSHRRLMEPSGIHFSAVYDGHIPVCTLQDDYGPVHIHLLPYIRPAEVRAIYPEAEINDYNDAVRTAIAQLSLKRKERNILVAHQFVTGATRCESEEIIVGGLDNVDAAVFNRFDYVALGHIHGRQHIRRDTIRYCGTPLKYSFSEQNHVKSVTVVELGEKGKVSIRELPLTPLHDMREICGTYPLTPAQAADLVLMTPLTQGIEKEQLDLAALTEVTIHLHILVGRPR